MHTEREITALERAVALSTLERRIWRAMALQAAILAPMTHDRQADADAYLAEMVAYAELNPRRADQEAPSDRATPQCEEGLQPRQT